MDSDWPLIHSGRPDTPGLFPHSSARIFPLGVVHSNVLGLKDTARGSRGEGRSAAIDIVGKRTANGEVKQDKVRVVNRLGPGRRGDVGGDDLPEEDAVNEPADGLELLRPVDFEGIGVEVALAGSSGTLPAAREAVRLVAGTAGVDAAV